MPSFVLVTRKMSEMEARGFGGSKILTHSSTTPTSSLTVKTVCSNPSTISSIVIVATVGATVTDGDGTAFIMVTVKLSAFSGMLSFIIVTLKHCW